MDPVRKAEQYHPEDRPEDPHKMQAQMRRLERQDWWLWGLAFVLLLLLTFAVASFSLPGLLGQADPFWQFHQRLAASALLGLVLLFVVYTCYQQLQIRRVRRRLAEQVFETAHVNQERRRAEELLCLSEDKFSKAFHANPTAMAISTLAEERYLEANDAFLRMVGYQKYELLGRTSMQLGIWVNQAHRSKLLVALQEKQKLDGEEFLFRTRQGDVRYGQLSAQVIELAGEKCLLSAVRDCTEQRRVEEAARESVERYRRSEGELRTLVDNAPCGIYRSSLETGRFVSVNPALVQMLGYDSAEQVLALDLARDVYRVPEDRARVGEALRDRERFQGLELRWKRKTGAELLVRASGRTVRSEGGKAYLEVIAEDITEHRILEY
jgi:PAS domain S-box-containing protein